MKLESEIARLIFPGFSFKRHDIRYAEKLTDMGVGGFCLYEGGVREIAGLTRELQSRAGRPLLFCADYEDGAGRWVKGAAELPSNMAIGASGSEKLARQKAAITANEARALGVDWVFAPVVDVSAERDNPIVNVRAFGEDPRLVSRLAGAYLEGFAAAGVLSCLKHFPGHGRTTQDSHLALPVLKRKMAQLEAEELLPYERLLEYADSVMIGHLMFPALDDGFPASYSKRIISGLLRKKMGYTGCVATDALCMKAIGDENAAAVLALVSGADVLLVPEDPERLMHFLAATSRKGVLANAVIRQAMRRIDKLVARIEPDCADRPGISVMNCAEHRNFVAAAAPQCAAWAVKPKGKLLKSGDKINYLELAAAGKEPKGAAFIDELKKLGVRVSDRKKTGKESFVAASFSNPQAYSGQINLGKEQKDAVCRNLTGTGKNIMVSFGSPYVFKGLSGRLDAGLCAFCAAEQFQRACARMLVGAQAPTGRMPVRL